MPDDEKRERFGKILDQLIKTYGGGSPGKLADRHGPNPPYERRTIQYLTKGIGITEDKLMRVSTMLDLHPDTLWFIYEGNVDGIKQLPFEREIIRQFILGRLDTDGTKGTRSRRRAAGS